jgi:hypothetical protein
MTEDYKPYAVRKKEERAIARAKREAEKAAWHRRIELMVECRMMALELTKAEIRDRGQKISKYTLAQLRQRAEEMIGPWLVAKARARIAERNSKHMSNSQARLDRALPVNKAHAQNEAAQ